jgi:uncharacterized protein (DUF427 family)
MSAPHRIVVEDVPQRVRVRVNGETVADTTSARVLREAGLPPRYYLPTSDIRMELLEEVPGKHTTCPFKGVASYYSAAGAGSVAWTYPQAKDESAAVEGMICFYDERPEVALELETDG